MKTFLSELKERNVVRVGAVYLGTAWLITHVGTILGENFEFPHWVMRSVIVFLALGFPVAIAVAWIYEATPEGLKRTGEVAPGRSIAHVTGRKLDRVIIAVLALVVAALLADRFLLHESLPGRLALPWGSEAAVYGTGIVIGVVVLLAATLVFTRIGRKRRAASAAAIAAPPATTLARADERVSLAVLPFLDMSPGKDQEYFSDGLSEELLNQLARVKDLRVAARTSCFAFKGQTADLRLVGEKLGVGHVLEGSVRKAGNRLRITAQLINAADGYHLWSDTFDRELDDVFAIQENVAREVAQALGVTLGLGEAARLSGGQTSLEAYDKYLRAGALIRNVGSPADLPRAVEMLRDTLALDPSFAPARGALASTYILMLTFQPETSEQTVKEMNETVKDALARAPDHWASHLANGVLLMQRHDWLEADAALVKARALAPSSESSVANISGLLLGNVGRIGEAVRVVEAARSADPLSPFVSTVLQQYLDMAGRSGDAQAEYERTKDLPGNREIPEHQALIRLWHSGDAAAIKAQAKRFFDSQAVPMPVLKEVYEAFDQPQAALGRIRSAFSDPAYQDATRMFILGLYAAHFGDNALATAAMRRAFIDMKGALPHTIWYPVMSKARKTPEFKELVRDIGLYDYWRQTGKWGDYARPVGKDDFEVL